MAHTGSTDYTVLNPEPSAAFASDVIQRQYEATGNARNDPADFDACYWIVEFVEIAHCGISRVRYDRQAIVPDTLRTSAERFHDASRSSTFTHRRGVPGGIPCDPLFC